MNQLKLTLYRKHIGLAGMLTICIGFWAFTGIEKITGKQPDSYDSCACFSPNNQLSKLTVYFNNKVPGDTKRPFTNQSQADCFAWSEFISVNWPTKGNYFGDPNDFSPVAWETYMPRNVLFQPNGNPPPAWGTLVSDEFAAKFKTERLIYNRSTTKVLTFLGTGVDSTIDFVFGDPNQAAPFGHPSWLGAQGGTNLWYEILLNKDYYDFVVKTGYYNAKVQHDSAKAGIPLNFPQGVYNGQVGAIEIKAAWMELTDTISAHWARYKKSRAYVLDPGTRKMRKAVVALVGMHILHKTITQPTWVWATFEQIDNVPDKTRPASPYGYNFYNSNCKAQQLNVPASALGYDSLTSPVTVGCTANVPPPYYLKDGTKPVPLQLERTNIINTTNAQPINMNMRDTIKKYYPRSVWQYYELVDVIWSQQVQPNPTKPINVPRVLNPGYMNPLTIVANTTMESYVQSTNTCTSCHVYGTIADYPPDSVNNTIFGDFSFAIGAAKYPKPLQTKAKAAKGKH